MVLYVASPDTKPRGHVARRKTSVKYATALVATWMLRFLDRNRPTPSRLTLPRGQQRVADPPAQQEHHLSQAARIYGTNSTRSTR
jgi:hypothetical protein